MDDVESDGVALIGIGPSAMLKAEAGYPLPTIQAGGVWDNALRIEPHQYLDLGPNNDRCLGRLDLCTQGFSFFIYIKFLLTSLNQKQYIFTNVYGYRYSYGLYSWVIPTSTHCMFGLWGWKDMNKVLIEVRFNVENMKAWHQYGITYHPEHGFQLYFDGQTFGSQSFHTLSQRGTIDGNVVIGMLPTDDDAHMDAYIDELVIYEHYITI